jgi:hypothetical protein
MGSLERESWRTPILGEDKKLHVIRLIGREFIALKTQLAAMHPTLMQSI